MIILIKNGEDSYIFRFPTFHLLTCVGVSITVDICFRNKKKITILKGFNI